MKLEIKNYSLFNKKYEVERLKLLKLLEVENTSLELEIEESSWATRTIALLFRMFDDNYRKNIYSSYKEKAEYPTLYISIRKEKI